MKSTRAVEVSIHAMSPLLGVGAAAAGAELAGAELAAAGADESGAAAVGAEAVGADPASAKLAVGVKLTAAKVTVARAINKADRPVTARNRDVKGVPACASHFGLRVGCEVIGAVSMVSPGVSFVFVGIGSAYRGSCASFASRHRTSCAGMLATARWKGADSVP